MRFFLPAQMQKHILTQKAKNPRAALMGLDVGTKFVGVALSDRELKKAVVSPTAMFLQPRKTFEIEMNVRLAPDDEEEREKNSGFYNALKGLVRNSHIRGLIVGYPLDHNQKEVSALTSRQMPHCRFIRSFLKKLETHAEFTQPVTLVNEYETTVNAKSLIVDMQQSFYPNNPDLILRKRLSDKMAAKVILQKFLDFHNDRADLLPISI